MEQTKRKRNRMTRLGMIINEKGFTYERMAELSGVSLSALQKLGCGARNINTASLDILVSIAEVLGVPFTVLLSDERLAGRVKANLRRMTVM